jgi:Uma2 family endonuclease
MATVQTPSEQRLVLYGVDWQTYGRLLRALDSRPGVRLTYDRGCLEIRTLSHEHEALARILDRFIVVLTEELGLPLKGGRSTTFRRRKKQRGLEPDDCYWIANEGLVRGKDRIQLRIDPPPDLALEIDITHSSLNRLAIYAALRVPEVWRYDGRVVVFHLLGADGQYGTAGTSRNFTGLAPADLASFLSLRRQTDENGLARQFRSWVRQSLVSRGHSQP